MNSNPDNAAYEIFLLRLKNSPKPIKLAVPFAAIAGETHVRCQDDSLPDFEPQPGHWVEKNKYYRVLGAREALNADAFSLVLETQDGFKLNPYGGEGDPKYGINAKRFVSHEFFDRIEIFDN